MNIRGNVVDLKTQPSYTPSSSPVRWGYPPTTTRSICPWVYSGRKMGSICRWVSVCVFLFSMTDRFHQNMIRFNVYLHVYMLIYQYIYIYTIIYTQLYVYIYIHYSPRASAPEFDKRWRFKQQSWIWSTHSKNCQLKMEIPTKCQVLRGKWW